jgi:hypothetical protein
MIDVPVAQILTYVFALWLGLYLLARNPGKNGLVFAGLGLVVYAVGIGLDVLASYAEGVERWRMPLLYLPALFWFGAALHLLPDTAAAQNRDTGLVIAAALVFVVDTVVNNSIVHQVIGIGALLLMGGALLVVGRAFGSGLPRRPLVVLFTVTIFFALSIAALLLPDDWLANDVVALGISLDIICLGYTIVVLDAYDEGEALILDVLRAFAVAMVGVLIFGGQVVLVMTITGTVTAPLVLLLLAIIATTLMLQAFADPLQALLDRFIFARLPHVQRERADHRAAARAAPRVKQVLNLDAIDDAQFTRYTRRALSNMGDLSRLASSPLTRLPVIEARLAGRGAQNNTLERAIELKALLTESILKLKPRDKGAFGTSDEWRYYNAVYFPYVVGLKPYSRRDLDDGPDPTSKDALDWFQAQVPERTLHNWQNAAARLIAQDLREQITS